MIVNDLNTRLLAQYLDTIWKFDNHEISIICQQEPILKRMGQDIHSPLKLFYFTQNMLIPIETKTFLVEEAEDFCHLVSLSTPRNT